MNPIALIDRIGTPATLIYIFVGLIVVIMMNFINDLLNICNDGETNLLGMVCILVINIRLKLTAVKQKERIMFGLISALLLKSWLKLATVCMCGVIAHIPWTSVVKYMLVNYYHIVLDFDWDAFFQTQDDSILAKVDLNNIATIAQRIKCIAREFLFWSRIILCVVCLSMCISMLVIVKMNDLTIWNQTVVSVRFLMLLWDLYVVMSDFRFVDVACENAVVVEEAIQAIRLTRIIMNNKDTIAKTLGKGLDAITNGLGGGLNAITNGLGSGFDAITNRLGK